MQGRRSTNARLCWGEGAKIFTTSKEGRKGMLWKGTRIWKEGMPGSFQPRDHLVRDSLR